MDTFEPVPEELSPTVMRGRKPRRSGSGSPYMMDYSGWSLRPEVAQDLGDAAPLMQGLLRSMGPSFVGAQLFRAVMSPPTVANTQGMGQTAGPFAQPTIPYAYNQMLAQVPESQQPMMRNVLANTASLFGPVAKRGR